MYKSFVCRFASFHPLSEKWGEVSNISPVRCGHRRRPRWYFNYREFRWSLDFIKIGVCPWRALKTPGKFLGKVWHRFWWSFLPNRSISHEGPWFLEGCVSIQTPVVGDFIVWPHKKFPRCAFTIIPWVWFSNAFQVSFAIFKIFFEFNVQFVDINKITTRTACDVERDEDHCSIKDNPMV